MVLDVMDCSICQLKASQLTERHCSLLHQLATNQHVIDVDPACSNCIIDTRTMDQTPEELKGLTLVEQLLISPLFVGKYHFGRKNDGTSPYCTSKDWLHMRLDRNSRLTLPRKMNKIGYGITAEANCNSTQLYARRSRVRRALYWLIKHNPIYKNALVVEADMEDIPEGGLIAAVFDRPTQGK